MASQDHKPCRADEQARVHKAGGFVAHRRVNSAEDTRARREGQRKREGERLYCTWLLVFRRPCLLFVVVRLAMVIPLACCLVASYTRFVRFFAVSLSLFPQRPVVPKRSLPLLCFSPVLLFHAASFRG